MNTSLMKAGVKNAKMWPIAPPKGPYGQGTSNEGMPWGYFFSGNDLEKAVEVFNYTFTQEFFLAAKGQVDYAFAPKPEPGPKGWPDYYSYEEALKDPGYEQRRKDVLHANLGIGWAMENRNMTKTWPDQELAKYVVNEFQQTLGGAQIEGNKLADRWAVTSSKTVPVPADAKYFVNLQAMFREIATKIVSGQDPDQVWSEWLAFYKANGGPEIEKQVNHLIPIE
jgi:hypothetical protein